METTPALDFWWRFAGMLALETLVIYLAPFLIIATAVKLLMKRRGADLSDVQAQAGPNRRARKLFLLGGWRSEE